MVKSDNHSFSQPYNSRGEAQYLARKKTVSPLLQGFIWGGSFVLTAFISGLVGVTIALKSPIPIDSNALNSLQEKIEAFKGFGFSSLFVQQLDQPINILVMGIDQVPSADIDSKLSFSGRSDTVLVVRFQPQDHSLRILSIPRDSRVQLPKGNYSKINSTNIRGGVSFTKQVIQQNLDGIVIDKYMRITTDMFSQLVDLIGGVEVYVPTDMQYTDRTQGLSIDLKQGKQTLNGNQAQQFARFRNDGLGDIGRVQRQQILIKALQKKIQSPQALFKIPQGLKLLQEGIDTDLTQKEILSLVSFCLNLKKENVRMVMLPGRASTPQEYRLSYWLISQRDKAKVIRQYLEAEPSRDSSPLNTRKSLDRIKIAIQNATPNREVPKAVANFLINRGFSNVYVTDSSPIPTQKTQIVVQKGDYSSAQVIRRTLDFGELEVSSTGDITSDITIRVGRDAERLLSDQSFTH